MADRVIRIVIDTGDANAKLVSLEDNLEDVEKQEKATASSSNALKQAFGALLAAVSIRELAQAADAFTLIGNRIRLVTDSQAEFNAVQSELIGISQRTRSDLGDTANLYARVARSTEELGRTQAETLQFTEAVNQAIQISGSTSAEASAGVIQFAQGLASGALRGDELRSVLEQMPRLARALADGFGVSIGELRKLGEAGELAGEAIFDIVLNQAPLLNEEFALITPTLGQAITTIRNFGTVAVGSFNEAAGITEGLVDIFKLTDDQTNELAASVSNMALAFRTAVEIATIATINFAETVPNKLGLIRNELGKFVAFVLDDEAAFLEALKEEGELETAIEERKQALQDEIELLFELGRARQDALIEGGADLDEPGERVDRGTAVDPAAAKELERIAKAQATLLASLQQQTEAMRIANETGREYSEVLQDLKIEALGAAGTSDTFTQEALDAAAALNMEKEAARLLREELERQNTELEDAAAITLAARDAAQVYADEVERLQGFLDKGLISRETFDASVENLKMIDDATADFFRRARENSQDILAGFLESGLQDLDGFAQAFAQMLLQLASQALAAGIFDAILGSQSGGSSTGGIIQGIVGAIGGSRQFGGGVQAGQTVNTGEGGRFGSEVFVPNVGGNVVPINGDRGGAAAAPPVVNNTIVNTIDPGEITGAFQSGQGDNVLLNRISTRKTAFRRALGV